MSHVTSLMMTLIMIVAASGCEAIGFVAQGFSSGKVESVYTLADRPTLVLVDDPTNRLGQPGTAYQIAHQIGDRLDQAEVLTTMIPPRRVYELADRLGEDYHRAAVDWVGRELGAQQVIHVHIASVRLAQKPGLYRPMASLRVKVLDVAGSRRLFPPTTMPNGSLAVTDHHPLTVQLDDRSTMHGDRGHGNRGEIDASTRRALAERIAHDVARLFYEHTPR